MNQFNIIQQHEQLNMPTSNILLKNSVKEETDMEFGRMCERRLFGVAVDWFVPVHRGIKSSAKDVISFAQDFISTIRSNDKMPSLPSNSKLQARIGSAWIVGIGGADLTFPFILW